MAPCPTVWGTFQKAQGFAVEPGHVSFKASSAAVVWLALMHFSSSAAWSWAQECFRLLARGLPKSKHRGGIRYASSHAIPSHALHGMPHSQPVGGPLKARPGAVAS